MANNFNPYDPTWWAMGTLAILNEALVAVPLFNRDYSEMFAKGGQIINTRRPHKMTAARKAQFSPIAAQDVGADNIAIPLNQQIYNSFTVQDLDQQYSIEDLMATYLRPAAFALARWADSVVLAQAAQFLLAGNIVGNATNEPYDNVVDGMVMMDNNLAPSDGRHLIVNPASYGRFQKERLLVKANESGSAQTLRTGYVGNLAGLDLFKTQNQKNNVLNTTAVGVKSITVAAGQNQGDTQFTSAANASPAVVTGDWVLIKQLPYKITNVTGTGPYTYTINRPLHTYLSANDVLFVTKGVTPNANYAAGYGEALVLNPAANQYVPALGDFVDINGALYGIVSIPAANTIFLDRPLDVAVATTDLVKPIPPSNYNFISQRDALTVVMRTLAPTKPGTGVLSAVQSYNNMGVRAQMWYNGATQTMQVSLDFLMGIQVLDYNLGGVVVS